MDAAGAISSRGRLLTGIVRVGSRPISAERGSLYPSVSSSNYRWEAQFGRGHHVQMSCMILCSFWGSERTACPRLSLWQKSRTSSRHVSSSATKQVIFAGWDPDLHVIMELASDSELKELSDILYGTSLFSPLVKSVAPGDGSDGTDIQETIRDGNNFERAAIVERLESRFLYLAADAKATLSGRRPRYRDVLLSVRRKLQIPCSIKLSTEDMEAEIFLFLLNEHSSKREGKSRFVRKTHKSPFVNDVRELKTRRWDVNVLTALKLGGEGLLAMMLKGGSAVTMSSLQTAVSKELSGKVLVETVKYQLAKDAVLKGGHAIATRLESHVAVLAARQGLAGASARYFTLRSTMMLIGPLLWGSFLADMVIRSLGTDYARVIRAIFAFAQIRITRTYGWTHSDTV